MRRRRAADWSAYVRRATVAATGAAQGTRATTGEWRAHWQALHTDTRRRAGEVAGPADALGGERVAKIATALRVLAAVLPAFLTSPGRGDVEALTSDAHSDGVLLAGRCHTHEPPPRQHAA